MSPRAKKILCLALAAVLLVGAAQVQSALNRDRTALGITRTEALDNAPPVLAFTTVALGGFRGLISNALWIRASELQDDDKFFEMAQLADWITKLEPHFVQVWLVQAWNMAYNISVKFKDYGDRWRWVEKGIALLRDEGLAWNKNEILIYRELAWFFQHKMGANLDDANMYYKQMWANEMSRVFAKKAANLDELINPETDDQKTRAALLRDTYKMDPVLMKQINERYGPLEWRLPEAHAIYWASLGLKYAEQNPAKVKPDDLITLRRVIYQSMQLSFQRGRLITNNIAKAFEFGPNLDIIPKVSAAYEQAMEEDAANRDHIKIAYRNLLRDAVYFLYVHNRVAEANRWFQHLGQQFPDKPILDGKPKSLPGTVSLEEYAVSRVQEDIGETSRDRVKSAVEGLLVNAYMNLVVGEDDRFAGFKLLAMKVREVYEGKIKDRKDAIGLESFESIDSEVVRNLLQPDGGVPPEGRAILRTKLNLPAEVLPTPEATPGTDTGATNSPPAEATSK